jgi:hypothetical protein
MDTQLAAVHAYDLLIRAAHDVGIRLLIQDYGTCRQIRARTNTAAATRSLTQLEHIIDNAPG